jgi:hypothetical protein
MSKPTYLPQSMLALILWIPEHFSQTNGYALGTLREASMELRQAAEKLDNRIAAAVAAGANPPDEPAAA